MGTSSNDEVIIKELNTFYVLVISDLNSKYKVGNLDLIFQDKTLPAYSFSYLSPPHE